MFLDFFHLHQQPFGVTPNPAYLYPSQTHREAILDLSSGIQDDRGFLALIAQPGMGKTTVLYQLLNELRDSARTAFIFQTQCDSHDFFGYLLSELGIQPEGMSVVTMHNRLNQVLFEEMLAGRRFVLVVDEAQNLDDSVLETVRLLSNFERENTKLLQIVLAGQPQLAVKLSHPNLAQLRQRITVMCTLHPFNRSETACYIEHRLAVAGYTGDPIFTQDALKLIAEQSGGVPRDINNICYSALSAAHRRGQLNVNAALVREVVGRLGLGVTLPQISSAATASARELVSNASAPVLSILEEIVARLNAEAYTSRPAIASQPSAPGPSAFVLPEPELAAENIAPTAADSEQDFTWELKAVAAPEIDSAPSEAPPSREPWKSETAEPPDKPAEIFAGAEKASAPSGRAAGDPGVSIVHEVVLELEPEPELKPPADALSAVSQTTASAAATPVDSEVLHTDPAPAVVDTAAPSTPIEVSRVKALSASGKAPEEAPAPAVAETEIALAAAAGASATGAAPSAPPPGDDSGKSGETSMEDHSAAAIAGNEPSEIDPAVADVFEALSLASPKVISEFRVAVAPDSVPPVTEVNEPIDVGTAPLNSPALLAPEKISVAAGAASAAAASPNISSRKPIHPAAATAAAAWRVEMTRRQMAGGLTYGQDSQSLVKRWLFRTLALTVALLAGSAYFFPSIVKFARPGQESTSASPSFGSQANAPAPETKSDSLDTLPTTYPADPQDTSQFQVVTVAAEPNQTLQSICMLYVGHFDSQLVQQIRFLNPEMTDSDHLTPGQLIRIPLPLKTLKKVADSGDAAAPAPPAAPPKGESLITRFWTLLRSRK